MPWCQVLVTLLCTILTVQSSPCYREEVLSTWNRGYKAVVKLKMEKTVDHWDVDVEFSVPLIKFQAWKGHVNKISDTHYNVSNTCYNNLVYSCQCFELPYLVRHEPMWEGNTTFKFNGELVPACDSEDTDTCETCPMKSCPEAPGSNEIIKSLPGLQGEYCEKGQTCWPTATNITNFKDSINGSNLSCLSLPIFIVKEEVKKKCLKYTGLYINNNCTNINPYTKGASYKKIDQHEEACMTLYQFLTNRNYVRIEWMPAFIVTAESKEDIMKAIIFANNHNLSVSVMSTGHDDQDRNAGPASNSLLIRTTCLTKFNPFPNNDFASVNDVKWTEGYAEVGAGLTFGQNYFKSPPHSGGLYELAKGVNREIAGGTCNSVGVVGWTLGGGRGWNSPKYGLGSDNLLQVDMIDANGDNISANFIQHPYLFDAIRGGGGGFGVIYSIIIKLHNSPCGSTNWRDCYTAKDLYIEDKYSDNSRNIVGNVTQMYMEWSLNYAKNKWNPIMTFNYSCITKNYTIHIQANCLEKTSDSTCQEFDQLINNITPYVKLEESMYMKTASQTKSNYWTSYGTETGTESNNGRWEQKLGSLIYSSAATNGFINTILDYWQPLCDQSHDHTCVSGFLIDGNLPALCEGNPTIPGCITTLYNTSVYNSGGSIPPESRSASFIVWNLDVLNKKKSLNLKDKEDWLHSILAPKLYDFSSKSYFNEAEYTLVDKVWEKRFWGDEIYKKLVVVKNQYDPNYRFGCRHCVGFNKTSA